MELKQFCRGNRKDMEQDTEYAMHYLERQKVSWSKVKAE